MTVQDLKNKITYNSNNVKDNEIFNIQPEEVFNMYDFYLINKTNHSLPCICDLEKDKFKVLGEIEYNVWEGYESDIMTLKKIMVWEVDMFTKEK